MSWQAEVPEWILQGTRALLLAVRAKDPLTFAHCVRVGNFSKLLAEAAGLSEYEQKVAECAGLLHDIGKISTPDAILLKPGRLTLEEGLIMQDHARMSAELLTPFSKHKFFKEVIPAVLYHHERVDGEGYPVGLKESEIPLISKVILVVDTFDAMTSDRVYRKGLPEEVAFAELKLYSGRQFDSELVKIFLDAYRFWIRQPGIKPQDQKPDNDYHTPSSPLRLAA